MFYRNSVSDIYHVVRDKRFELKVESSGRVWWHPTGIIKTYCKLQLKYFPFDKYVFFLPFQKFVFIKPFNYSPGNRQNCRIQLESPTLDVRLMNLTLRPNHAVDTIMYISGETWNLLGLHGVTKINKVTRTTSFARVEFVIRIERAKIYHLLNVILPAIFLSFVQIMFFYLPATHPQRVGSTTTTLLSVVVFQTVAASALPKTSTDVPILAIYIFVVTFISGLSVSTSIFIAKMSVLQSDERNVDNDKANMNPEKANTSDQCFQCPRPSSRGRQRDWQKISQVFDQVMFMIAAIIAISSPLILFVFIPMSAP